MLKYQDLPFGNHPWDEFGVRILGCMNCFSFIVWRQVWKGYCEDFFFPLNYRFKIGEEKLLGTKYEQTIVVRIQIYGTKKFPRKSGRIVINMN